LQGILEEGAGTVRRLDRIEKEMGYCEVKLEKERRLRSQHLYLKADVEALDEVLGTYDPIEVEASLKSSKLRGIELRDIPKTVRRGDKTLHKELRNAFSSMVTYGALREEREILANELEGVDQRLAAYGGFERRRDRLEEQRRRTLEGLGLPQGEMSSDVVRSFQMTESRWNGFSEDFANVEVAVYHLERDLDYLHSARNFILAGRATFDIEEWRLHGCFSDLLKHSPVGRAFEMIQGADTNVKLAEKELICLTLKKFGESKILRVVGPFIHALFDDLFVLASIQNTKNVLEDAETKNRARFQEFLRFREKLAAEKGELEARREQQFAEMGEEVKRIVFH
jgi:hypothetical protein